MFLLLLCVDCFNRWLFSLVVEVCWLFGLDDIIELIVSCLGCWLVLAGLDFEQCRESMYSIASTVYMLFYHAQLSCLVFKLSLVPYFAFTPHILNASISSFLHFDNFSTSFRAIFLSERTPMFVSTQGFCFCPWLLCLGD